MSFSDQLFLGVFFSHCYNRCTLCLQAQETKPTPNVEEQKEAVETVQPDVPKIEIKIEDKVVQDENEKNQEKNEDADLTNEDDKATLELKYKYKEGVYLLFIESAEVYFS